MEINLNNPKELTMANVARLLAALPDTCHTQIRVRTDGTAYLSMIFGNNQTDGHSFMLPVFVAGNSYVGEDAASDKRWARTIFGALKRNWPRPESFVVGLEAKSVVSVPAGT